MPSDILELIGTKDGENSYVLRCPSPGRVLIERTAGEFLVPGSRLGTLICDQRPIELVVPAGVRGQIAAPAQLEDRWVNRGYNDPLVTLLVQPTSFDLSAADRVESVADAQSWIVRAPGHGTFYRSAGPGQPFFVEVGQQVEPGQTIGLVEVMKCFAPITFQPPIADRPAVLREILVGDGVEVQLDQPLFRLESPD